MNQNRGFTIFELILIIGLVAIVGGIGVIALRPDKQLAQSRNDQRILSINSILNAVRQNIADNRGTFSCAAGDVPISAKKMAIGVGNFDIAPCIVPIYLFTLPFDPKLPESHYSSNTDYDTGFNIVKNSSTTQITISAPGAELNQIISVTR